MDWMSANELVRTVVKLFICSDAKRASTREVRLDLSKHERQFERNTFGAAKNIKTIPLKENCKTHNPPCNHAAHIL